MKIKKLVFTALFSALFSFGHAQGLIVRGTLLDDMKENPVSYANCVLLHTADSSFAYGVTSKDNGQFIFKEVDTGKYYLRINFIGYEPYWSEIAVTKNMILDTIRLRSKANSLKAVNVTSARPLYSTDGEKNIYNVTEDPSVQSGNVTDVLQNAPGVEVDADGNITLRGSGSVEIWINGRPSHMNSEALKQYLKELPANSVERVEVISNPSARYSSSGAVINIVTNQKIKRNELFCFGMHGSTRPYIGPWVSYVWANEKVHLNLYMSGSYSHNLSENEGSNLLINDNGDTTRSQEYKSESEDRNIGGYMGFNLGWEIDSMTDFSFWMGAYPYYYNSKDESRYNYFEHLPSLNDLSYRYTGNGKSFSGGGYGGADLEHRFDTTGRKISFSLYGNAWMRRTGNGKENEESYFYSNPAITNLIRRDYGSHFSPSINLGIDYSHPFKNGIELETGIEGNFDKGSGEQHLDVYDNIANEFIGQPYRSYTDRDYGRGLECYLTAQKRWGGLTAKLGLRAEENWEHDEWEHIGLNDKFVIDTAFGGFVPSIHLSYTTKGFHSFRFNYTRRYSSPDISQLSGFIYYSDYSYSTGNPALRYSYTHNIEAGWSKFFQKFGNIGIDAYFRANTDKIESMTDVAYSPYHEKWVNYSYPINVGSSHTEGIQANATYRPTAMFNLRMGASVSNYYYKALYKNEIISDSKISYSLRVNLWVKLWNKVDIFAGANYSSASIGIYRLSLPSKWANLGCSADFFKRRMSVSLNVNDPFDWSKWESNGTNPHYITTNSSTYHSRSVSLGLTFRFGKMELESQARQGAASAPMGK